MTLFGIMPVHPKPQAVAAGSTNPIGSYSPTHWFDFTDSASYTLDGNSRVSSITNKGSDASDATSPDGNRPLIASSNFGGLDAGDFETDTNRYFTHTYGTALSPQPCSLLLIFRTSTASLWHSGSHYEAYDSGDTRQLVIQPHAGQDRVNMSMGTGNTIHLDTSDGAFGITLMQNSATLTKRWCNYDDTDQTSNKSTSAYWATGSDATDGAIGDAVTTGSENTRGHIFEIAIWDSYLSDANVNSMMADIYDRYGITGWVDY